MELKNKVVVLTGAGSGIGKALSSELVKAGAKLALNDWDETLLAKTVQALNLPPERIWQQAFDVADRQAFENFIENSKQHFGAIDVLINNAGVSLGRFNWEEVNDENLHWLLDINLMAPIYASRYILPHLKSRPQASLVFLSSLFGLAGIANQVPYCISKFGIRGLGESLRMELADTQVNVLNIHPGGIKTNIVRFGRMKEAAKAKEIDIFDKHLAITTAESAAQQIVVALQKNKQRLLIGKDARYFDKLIRLFPVRYTKMFNSVSKRLLKKAK